MNYNPATSLQDDFNNLMQHEQGMRAGPTPDRVVDWISLKDENGNLFNRACTERNRAVWADSLKLHRIIFWRICILEAPRGMAPLVQANYVCPPAVVASRAWALPNDWKATLRSMNYSRLYTFQHELILSLARGENCMAVWPTGSGKTLPYLLIRYAIISLNNSSKLFVGKIVIAVLPTISLTNELLISCQDKYGIRMSLFKRLGAVLLNSTLSKKQLAANRLLILDPTKGVQVVFMHAEGFSTRLNQDMVEALVRDKRLPLYILLSF
jgi:hypothetical protein